MARKPINQHRMLTATKQGRVARITSTRWKGSWQVWEAPSGPWRPVTSGENKALDALADSPRPMIEAGAKLQSDVRTDFVVTEYGEITLQLWNDELGPVAVPGVS